MESSISEMRYVFTDEAKADLIQIRRFTLKKLGTKPVCALFAGIAADVESLNDNATNGHLP